MECAESLTSQLFVVQRTVDNGSVEQRHAPVHCLMKQADTLLLVGMTAPVVSHAHHAEAQR